MTYNTLRDRKHIVYTGPRTNTYFTAGARAASATVPNPAARTAVACKKPMMTRTPTGISAMAGLPISKTKKKNQSVTLKMTVSRVITQIRMDRT